MLQCLVIDDEPVARQGIQEYIADTDYLKFIGSCDSALKATQLMQAYHIDLIFLDIQMPKVSGIDFLKSLRNPPLVIFTTAFAEFAIEGYTLDVIDYLMKPVTFERFLKATQKAYELHEMKRNAQIHRDRDAEFFFVKVDGRFEKINLDDIVFVESLQNYVIINTSDRKLITYMTLTGIANQLPADRFIKVHKSYIVSLHHVKSIDGNELVMGTSRVPISRNLRESVLARILGDNLFRR